MEFINEFRESRKRVLCNIVLDRLADWPFKRFNTGIRRILALALLFTLFEIIELLVLVIIRQPVIPALIISLVVALIASLSFYVVGWCYQYTLEQTEAAIRISTLGRNVEKRLADWLRKTVNPWIQLITSVVSIILFVLVFYVIPISIYSNQEFNKILGQSSVLYKLVPFLSEKSIVERRVGFPFKWNFATFVFVSLVIFGMSQGGYWAIVTPLITRELKRSDISEIRVYPLSK